MKRLYIGIVLSIFCLPLSGMEAPDSSAPNPYDLVFSAHQHALSRTDLPIRSLDSATDEDSQQLSRITHQQISLSEYKIFERVTNLFKERSSTTVRETVPVKTLQQLEILASNHHESDFRRNCVLLQFPTLTTSGRVLLAKQLVTFSDVSKLRAFQAQIRSFDPEVVVALRAQLGVISRSEQVPLSLLASNLGYTYDLIESYVRKRTPNAPIANPFGAKSIGLANAASGDLEGSLDNLYRFLLNIFTKESAKNDAFITTLQALLQHKTATVFTFHQAVKSIGGSITSDSTPTIKRKLDDFLQSDNAKKLVDLNNRLQHVTDPITRLGLYFQTTTLSYLMKDDLLTVYKAIGKLDKILSIAHLINNSEHPRPPFCFAEFTGTEKVTLELDEYWNVLLPHDKPLTTNSITIGPEDPHIVIVAGVNATGKTTAIKAITLCQYLAAMTGIAPARVCKISKPAKVFTSISEKDRLASQDQGGKSLLQAQVEALNNLAANAKDNPQPSILTIDEPLTATNARMAKVAITAFFEKLKKLEPSIQKKTICLITSHLEEVRQFGTDEPQTYRLMYGHEDFTVDDNGEGALDYSTMEEEILAMLGD